MISGGLTAAYRELVPQFEAVTGHKVITAFGPSMGTTENTIPIRIARGESVDVLIMVGSALIVARGEADIGFQQVSELLPIRGADLVGQLPPEVQKITVYSAGISIAAKEPVAGKALITFLASPVAAPILTKSGLEPITVATQK
jgi:ABC-type molybdate transport system substrate-binding protein